MVTGSRFVPSEIGSDSAAERLTISATGADATVSERPGVTLGCLGHFQLLKRLGCGSFGEVFAAVDVNRQAKVAFKISWRSLDEALATNFMREAAATAQLQHPYIARVHEVGKIGDRVYMASDLVEGTTLDVWSKVQKPTSLEVIQLCGRLAALLQYAHSLGVVHRDLKPSNVMIDAESQPYLVDFGLARDGANQSTEAIERYQAMRHELLQAKKKQSPKRIMGTPAYMSPEQAAGKAHCADGRSDIYSLGVILYELLTSRRPFDGTPEQLRRRICQRHPVRPRRINRSIPPAIEAICIRAMAKIPDDRYASGGEMAEDCGLAYAGQPISWRLKLGLATVWPILVWKVVRVNDAKSAGSHQ